MAHARACRSAPSSRPTPSTCANGKPCIAAEDCCAGSRREGFCGGGGGNGCAGASDCCTGACTSDETCCNETGSTCAASTECCDGSCEQGSCCLGEGAGCSGQESARCGGLGCQLVFDIPPKAICKK